MSTEPTLMDWLEPPAHGLNDLKGKIARRDSRKKTVAGSAALAIVVCTTIAFFHDGIGSAAPNAPSNREWQAAISTREEGLSVINGAALELSARDADTRIYLVSTMPEKPRPGSG